MKSISALVIVSIIAILLAIGLIYIVVKPPSFLKTTTTIIFEGRDILRMNEKEVRQIRGNKIAMIFQEPMTSLNPVFTIGDQIAEVIMLHQKANKEEAKKKTIEILYKLQIPDPEIVIKKYPHELSGGMQQRVMIAMALSCNPKLLIADEPTTALDATIQVQILKLIEDLKQIRNLTIMLITHDLGIAMEICTNIIVMYAGKIVEKGCVKHLYRKPLHPYTQGLLRAALLTFANKEDLYIIPGEVPNPLNFPSGCRFHPRCSLRKKVCIEQEPQLIEVEKGHSVACHYYSDVNDPKSG